MDSFLLTKYTIGDGLGMGSYSLGHLLWLLMIAAVIAVLGRKYRTMDGKGQRVVLLVLAALSLADELFKDIVPIATGQWNWAFLPLHICSISIFAIIAHALTRSSIAAEFLYAVSLSKERVRVAGIRHNIGSGSRLDYQQALVDFNADSAQYIKQQETLHTSRIHLNELMAVPDVDEFFIIRDSLIDINANLQFDELWDATLATNASLLQANQDLNIARLDYKKVRSRDYPYLRLNTGYGYTYNKYDSSSPTRKSGNLGFNAGLTLGFNLFDGNRRREFHNARLAIENSELARQQLEQSLRADLMNMWQAYQNNLNLLNLERQNLITARDNHDIAITRYMEGDLSGIEVREAQQSLLDAEERILSVQYDIKVCEISLLQLSGKILEYLR